LRVRNTGAYPIRITGVIGADGAKATRFNAYAPLCGATNPANIIDYFYLGPGEEKYFGGSSVFGTACNWQLYPRTGSSTAYYVGGASSVCQNSSSAPGTLDYKSIGFEYIEYILPF